MRLKAELALAGVAYHYPGTERLAVEDVSLVIRKGALVGLVGPSGSGKTTILDLTLGLLTPSGGRLLVDGQDIHEDLRAWQANIGYVPQIAYILDDSIRRNVALGVADTEIDDDRVWWALHAAQLESFVTSLPRRLDTIVGERGSRVSGGERQRLGIARALYHDPDVLVMDEPTSALDYATEHEVLRVIDAMKGQKTMLVVAHRLSTVRSCDEIYMVRHGGVSGPLQYENVAALAQAGGDVR
jgi:ATP-binding cassette subfamily C protein